MKKTYCQQTIVAVLLAASSASILADDMEFCPDEWDSFSLNGDSKLEVWGTSLSDPLIANPDYGWPTEASIYSWLDTLKKARENGGCVTVYYDPNLNGGSPNGHDIWSVVD